jgi:fibro-slime domain-containing protein
MSAMTLRLYPLACLSLLAFACSSAADSGGGGNTGGASATSGGGGNSGVGGGGIIPIGGSSGVGSGPGDCGHVIPVTIRDFTEVTSPDFEMASMLGGMAYGPVVGMLAPTLGADDKPVFASGTGTCRLLGGACVTSWLSGADTVQLADKIPMITSAATFNQWYNDAPGVNQTFQKEVPLTENPAMPGEFVYDSNTIGGFFPLLPTEGLGVSPASASLNSRQLNFLFTTEAHVTFTYKGDEVFSFSGDDDLWIFVNGKIALDLGGLHGPAEGTIDFNAQAEALGLTIGQKYPMDIFHAERMTGASNFKVTTTIDCFDPIIR